MQQWLSRTPNSLHQDGGIQRFAAVLLFNPPGSIRLADPDSNLLPGSETTSAIAPWHQPDNKLCAFYLHINYPAISTSQPAFSR